MASLLGVRVCVFHVVTQPSTVELASATSPGPEGWFGGELEEGDPITNILLMALFIH